MKLCHVVSHVDEEASGPSYSVPRLATALGRLGHDVILATLDRGGGQREFDRVRHIAFAQASVPRKLGRSPTMRGWLNRAGAEGIDLIHSHGLWMMPNIYPAQAAARCGTPHVIAPRGTLDPAALVYSRWSKRIFWHLGQARALRNATAFHATSLEEASHIRAQGLKQPIVISPNGIDLPAQNHRERGARRTLLYLGRLHEKKGLDLLLQAWASLEGAYPDWDLRIVGKGAIAFETALTREVAARNLTRVAVEGPAYGARKLEAFADADLFVLPTRGENFGMVVAEALASGTPVVTTTGAPWEGLVTHRAGWWCAPDVPAIEAALRSAMGAPRDALNEMGARGRSWMEAEYGWNAIGARLDDFYRWLISGGAKPADVVLD